MGVVLVVSLITTRVVLKALGADDYGIYNVVCGFVALFAFLNNTLSGSINRFYNYELGQSSKNGVCRVFNASLRIQAIITCALVFIVELIGIWYINNILVVPPERLFSAKLIFHLSLFSLAVTIMQAPFSAAVMAYERMNYYALVSIVDVILKLLIAFAVLYSDNDRLVLYAVLMTFISVINFILYFFYCKKEFNELRLTRDMDRSLFHSMISFSGWTILDPIAYTIRGQGCNMELNYFYGPSINTAYSLSNQVASGLDSFSSNIMAAFRPQLVQSYSAGETERAKRMLFSMTKIMFLLNSMIYLPFVFEMDSVMRVWLGSPIPSFAIVFTQLILIVKLTNTFSPPITNLIMATGKVKIYMLCSSLIVSAVLPVSFVFLLKNSSPEIIYYVMLFLTVINIISSLLILQSVFNGIRIKQYVRVVIFPCSVQLLLILVPLLFLHIVIHNPLVRFLAVLFCSVAISIVSSYFVLFDNNEKRIVSTLLKSIKIKIGIDK